MGIAQEDLLASVIVPTYRGRLVLRDCLMALRTQSESRFEVVVVDDGSGDGTADWIAAHFPEAQVVELQRNMGFCRAVNEGIHRARASVIVLLNDDTIPDRHWLSELLAAFSADPGVGFCASRMLRDDAPEILDGAGDGYSRHGLSFRVGRDEFDDGRHTARAVLWASGGACAYRRAVLDEIGLLDESFKAYYEDVDLGLRARSAGWDGRYVPESVVRHIGGWSDRNRRSTMLTTRNSLLVLAKHWPGTLLLRNLPYVAYGQARNALWAVRTGQGRAWLVGVCSAVVLWRRIRSRSRPRVAPWASELANHYPFGGGATSVPPRAGT